MLWILAILIAAVVAFLILVAVLSFKLLVFVIGIALVVLAIALIVLPAIGLAMALAREFRAPATTRRIARLILLGVAAAALIIVDVIWIFRGLHWAQVPLLALVLIGAATGGLALLQEPVPVWTETPPAR